MKIYKEEAVLTHVININDILLIGLPVFQLTILIILENNSLIIYNQIKLFLIKVYITTPAKTFLLL